MTAVTENDIKRLDEKLDKLSDNFDKLTNKFDKMTEIVNQLAVSQARLESELKGEIKALDQNFKGEIKALDQNFKGEIKALNETVKGIDKRLNNIELLNRIIFGGVIGSVFIALIKYLFFSNNVI